MNRRTCFSILLLMFIGSSYLNSQQSENVRLDQMLATQKLTGKSVALATIVMKADTNIRYCNEWDYIRCVRVEDSISVHASGIQSASAYCLYAYTILFSNEKYKNQWFDKNQDIKIFTKKLS